MLKGLPQDYKEALLKLIDIEDFKGIIPLCELKEDGLLEGRIRVVIPDNRLIDGDKFVEIVDGFKDCNERRGDRNSCLLLTYLYEWVDATDNFIEKDKLKEELNIES